MASLIITEVAAYLAANGIGTVGQDIFLEEMPPDPIVATCVVSSSGVVVAGNPVDRPGFQILIRGTDKAEQLTRAWTIHELLHDKWNMLSTTRGRIEAMALPGGMFRDEAGNRNLSLNFLITRAPGGS